MKLFFATGFIFLLLTGMSDKPDHTYSATISPFQDTIVPGFDNELTFLQDGEEMDGSPENWKYSFEVLDGKVIDANGKTIVRCEEHKNERTGYVLIFVNKKMVYKKGFPVVVMTDALKKRVAAYKKIHK